MAFFHPLAGSNLFNHPKKGTTTRDDDDMHEEEFEAQQQWKRDFEEGDNGIIGEIREKFRNDVKENRLPSTGLHIDVRSLSYSSHQLHSHIQTVSSFVLGYFDIYHRLKNRFFPDESKNIEILSDVTFTINERSMTLVLGSPGSGKVSTQKLLFLN